MQVKKCVQITNPNGLHARPCHAVVSTALGFDSKLLIRYNGREVDGKSILQLMTLNAAQDAELELTGDGEDAGPMLEAIAVLFVTGFEESL